MKVYLLDNGYMSCDRNWIVNMATYATEKNRNPENVWTKMPVYCTLIDHPQGKFIYDLGMDRHINEYMHEIGRHQEFSFPYTYSKEQLLENQLALCNTTIDEIKGIVVSHLHYDHIGNLPLFHDIDVYVPKEDYENALVKGKAELYFDQYIKRDDIHYIPIDHNFTLVPGVEIVHLGSSHCPGLLGMLVELEEQNLFYPSDVLYTKENFGPPLRPRGREYDSLGFKKVAEEIRTLVNEKNAKIMYPHDIEEFETYKKAPAYYR
ncbi:MAG: N-acyl homoserine lactonase family protein [Erysipelotrichaceae bacterium]|nr:N-acyl homoserine lactonase family protein [Erysipelotrichaceae bacterium]